MVESGMFGLVAIIVFTFVLVFPLYLHDLKLRASGGQKLNIIDRLILFFVTKPAKDKRRGSMKFLFGLIVEWMQGLVYLGLASLVVIIPLRIASAMFPNQDGVMAIAFFIMFFFAWSLVGPFFMAKLGISKNSDDEPTGAGTGGWMG